MCKLCRDAEKNIGWRVAITTLGGFLLVDVVSLVINKVAVLNDANILSPGMHGSSIETVGSVAVNLGTLTSVSG